jgi:putative ABC transport system permease protein
MNLATARALNRAKEVGVRKVVGALRWQLMAQFLAEAVVLALAVSFVLLELFMLPAFAAIIGNDVSFSYAGAPALTLAMIVAGILTGLLAGSYPAFYLSSFVPAHVLKSKTAGGGKSTMRKFLLVLQFGIASFLIIGTLVVIGQMRFMKSSKLGFKKEQVVCLEAPLQLLESYDAFKQNLLRHNGVEAVSRANSVPGREHTHFPTAFWMTISRVCINPSKG